MKNPCSKGGLDQTRRDFIKRGLVLSGTAVAVVQLLDISTSHAQNTILSEDDPVAVSLGYKHDARQVDVVKFPRRATPDGAKEFCNNCQLYSGKAGESWGPCAIFPGRHVNANGWCNVWAQK